MNANIRNRIKAMLNGDSRLLKTGLRVLAYVPFRNRFRLRGNRLELGAALLKGVTMDVYGAGNTIVIPRGCQLRCCSIYINGNNNRIELGPYVSGLLDICIEDNNGTITIGEHCSFAGLTHLACIEGSTIEIGEDCMFSGNISIRTGDSHSITDLQGNRINPSKPVKIGSHVWVGNTVLMTKGVTIADNSIVGTGSVVTRQFEEPNVILAGNPAKIIRREVDWKRERF